jgi:hypothetical protein
MNDLAPSPARGRALIQSRRSILIAFHSTSATTRSVWISACATPHETHVRHLQTGQVLGRIRRGAYRCSYTHAAWLFPPAALSGAPSITKDAVEEECSRRTRDFTLHDRTPLAVTARGPLRSASLATNGTQQGMSHRTGELTWCNEANVKLIR